jgi:hypothetical protein
MNLPLPPPLHTPKSTVTQTPVDAFKYVIRTTFPTHTIELDVFLEYFGTDNVRKMLIFKLLTITRQSADKSIFYVSSNILQKMLYALQLWYVSQPSPSLSTWYSITPDDLQTFRIVYRIQWLISSVNKSASAAQNSMADFFCHHFCICCSCCPSCCISSIT